MWWYMLTLPSFRIAAAITFCGTPSHVIRWVPIIVSSPLWMVLSYSNASNGASKIKLSISSRCAPTGACLNEVTQWKSSARRDNSALGFPHSLQVQSRIKPKIPSNGKEGASERKETFARRAPSRNVFTRAQPFFILVPGYGDIRKPYRHAFWQRLIPYIFRLGHWYRKRQRWYLCCH